MDPTGGLLGPTGDLLGRTAELLDCTARALGTAAGLLDTNAEPLGRTAAIGLSFGSTIYSSLLQWPSTAVSPSPHCWATMPTAGLLCLLLGH